VAANTTEEYREAATDCLVEMLSTPEGQAMLVAKRQELREVSSARTTARFVLYRLDELFGPLQGQVKVLQDAEYERRRREQDEARRLKRAEYNRKRSEARKRERAEKQPTELRPVASIAAD